MRLIQNPKPRPLHAQMLEKALGELPEPAKAAAAAVGGRGLAGQLAGLMSRQVGVISRLQEGVATKSRHLAQRQVGPRVFLVKT